MALSNSINYTQNAETVIRDACYEIGALGENEQLQGERLEVIKRKLNRLIKRFQSMGVNIWTYTNGYVFLAKNQLVYTMDGSTDHITDSFVGTEIATAASSGATSLVLDSTSGITANDFIGIELDDGTRQWTTVASITNSTTLVVNTALTDTAAVDNTVFTYTTKSPYCLDVIAARYYDYGDEITTPITMITRKEYDDIPDNTFESQISCFCFKRGNRTGTINIWPKTDNVQDYLKITYQRVFNDIDDLENDIDCPPEWLEAFILSLSVSIAPIFKKKVPEDVRVNLKDALTQARKMDNEPTYIEVVDDSNS